MYFQKPSNITSISPAIDISPNKFEFFQEELPNRSQPTIQTSQSFANFDNNPVFSTSFDSSKNIGMHNSGINLHSFNNIILHINYLQTMLCINRNIIFPI